MYVCVCGERENWREEDLKFKFSNWMILQKCWRGYRVIFFIFWRRARERIGGKRGKRGFEIQIFKLEDFAKMLERV